MAWADAVAAEAQAQLAAQALEQATDRRQAMEARHNAGDAAPLDVHLARLAEIQAAADRIAAQNTAAQARVALARFVPDAATVALPRDPRAAAPAPSQGTTRADVDAAEHRVEAAQAEQRAARAAGLPVVSLGAFVEQEGGELAVGPAAELTLPLWKVNPEGRAQANAAVQVASADAAALRATANTELLTMTAALTIASEVEVRLSTDASADAIAALAAVEEAHQRGELSVVTATLLRQEIVVAWSAAIELEREVARARISALLATSDPALLPLDLREESR